MSTTGSGVASLSGLPDASGGNVVSGVATVVVGARVVDDELDVVVGGTVVGLAVVEGTTVVSGTVDGEVVSTAGCVSGGGGMVVVGTVEEVEVVDVELVCPTVLVGSTVSVDVVVGSGNEPTHSRESNNQRSQSAGKEKEIISRSSGATTWMVASQHDPSTGNWAVVSSP